MSTRIADDFAAIRERQEQLFPPATPSAPTPAQPRAPAEFGAEKPPEPKFHFWGGYLPVAPMPIGEDLED